MIDKIDSEAPRAENVSQSPAADVWSREKLISADVRDIAMEMDWDAAIDDDGNFYSYPVPAEDGETGGSGIDEVFLSEDKNAGPNDQGNIPVSSALFLDTDGAHAISTTVNHNGTYYLIMTDKVGNRAEVPIVVTTIDTKLPVVMDVTHTPCLLYTSTAGNEANGVVTYYPQDGWYGVTNTCENVDADTGDPVDVSIRVTKVAVSHYDPMETTWTLVPAADRCV